MKSKLRLAGEFIIDHKNAPGITPEFLRKAGIVDMPAVGSGAVYETRTMSCCCCPRDVLVPPPFGRELVYCRKCDRYMCEFCAAAQQAGAAHIPYKQRVSDAYDITQRTGKTVKLYV